MGDYEREVISVYECRVKRDCGCIWRDGRVGVCVCYGYGWDGVLWFWESKKGMDIGSVLCGDSLGV